MWLELQKLKTFQKSHNNVGLFSYVCFMENGYVYIGQMVDHKGNFIRKFV